KPGRLRRDGLHRNREEHGLTPDRTELGVELVVGNQQGLAFVGERATRVGGKDPGRRLLAVQTEHGTRTPQWPSGDRPVATERPEDPRSGKLLQPKAEL